MGIHKIIILLLFSFLSFNAFPQKVSNIKVEQDHQTIIISYFLDSEFQSNIELYYSIDDEKTWVGPLKKVSGDVGQKISKGEHKINWNVLEELEQFQGNNIKFKILATGYNFGTIQIGNQTWSSENISIDHFVNGDIIPQAKSVGDWLYYSSQQKPAWCYYKNEKANASEYGKLYNWYTVANVRQLCPVGWHVPNNKDWQQLIDFLGGASDAGGQLKEIGNKHWNNPNEGATNTSLFTALPSGYRKEDGTFSPIGAYGAWWSLNQSSKTYGNYFYLSYDAKEIYKYSFDKSSGLSVRCIKD